jgi:hypothetical protein
MWRVVVAMACWGAFACSANRSVSTLPTIDCINGYDVQSSEVPTAAHTIVLRSVVLPTERALRTVRSGLGAGPALWSKDGLVVSTDSAVELRVADEWRGKFSFGWGQPADRPVEHLRVPACASTRGAGKWLAFTGGYYVADPACVSLIVTVGHAQQRVQLGMGAPCPGQGPPDS